MRHAEDREAREERMSAALDSEPMSERMTEAEWTIEHGEEAESQGWNIFESDERGLEIQRDDEAGIFDTDEDAVKYVERQAARGNECAASALRLVGKKSMTRAELQARIDGELETWAKQYHEVPNHTVAGAVARHVLEYLASVDRENGLWR